MTHYHIQCDHQHSEAISDYYPLSTPEIINLLETARATLDHINFNPREAKKTIASIQIRLGQGVPGSMCPTQLDTPKQNAIDEAYVSWLKDPMTLFLKEQPITERDPIVAKLVELMK